MPVKTEWPDFFSSPNFESWQELNCSRTLQPRFQREVREMHQFALEEKLLEPRLAYAALPITDIGEDWINLENGSKFTGANEVASNFAAADELVLAVGTIGEGLEKAIAEMFQNKNAIKALALEEVAVAAIFEFTNAVLSSIDGFAVSRELQASSPIYPGHGDFGIEQQRRVFELASGDEIGMRVLKTDMLYPAKSISLVFGLGRDMPRWDRKKDCETCKAREHCRFRNPESLAA